MKFLLPRGTLREPPRNLRRASYVFITKSSGEPNDELIGRIRRYNRTAEIIECAHQPIHLQNVLTGERAPLERLRDTYIGSICGIAAPESFEGGLRKLRSAHRAGEEIYRSSPLQRRNCRASSIAVCGAMST